MRDQDEILLRGVDSDLADRYRTAKQKVRERTGVNLSIAGGGRSRERQQKYFEEGKTPYDGNNPNAPHPLGLALDLNWKALPGNIQSVAEEELRNVGLRQGGRLANGYSEKHHWQLPAVTDGSHIITGLDDVGSSPQSAQPAPQTISDGNIEVDFSPQESSTKSLTTFAGLQSNASRPNEVNVPPGQLTDVSTLQRVPKKPPVVIKDDDISDLGPSQQVEFQAETPGDRGILGNLTTGARAVAGTPNTINSPSMTAGKSLTIHVQSDKTPTQEQLSDALLEAMGAKDIGQRYREETGRNLLNPSLSPDDLEAGFDPSTKTYSAVVQPTKQDFDVVNAYSKGGLEEAQKTLGNNVSEQQKAIGELEQQRQYALKVLKEKFGVTPEQVSEGNGPVAKGLADTALGLTHLLNNVSAPFRSPENVQAATNRATEAERQIPEEKSSVNRIVRGAAGLASSLPEYSIGGPEGAAIVAYLQNRHKGVWEAAKSAAEMYAAGKVLHGAAGKLEGASPVVRQLGARGAAAATGIGLAAIEGERDPTRLLEQGAVMAGMPIGKKAEGVVEPERAPEGKSEPLSPVVEAPVEAKRGLATIGEQLQAKEEQPHYDRQNRRVRNTKNGNAGQFKPGFKEEDVPETNVPTAQVVSPDNGANGPAERLAGVEVNAQPAQTNIEAPPQIPQTGKPNRAAMVGAEKLSASGVAPSEGAKQPWEMTQAEFTNSPDAYNEMRAVLGNTPYKEKGDYSGMTPEQAKAIQEIEARSSAYNKMREEAGRQIRAEALRLEPDKKNQIEFSTVKYNADSHRLLVEKALREGKVVPSKVLADYPDLAKKYSSSVEQPTQGESNVERNISSVSGLAGSEPGRGNAGRSVGAESPQVEPASPKVEPLTRMGAPRSLPKSLEAASLPKGEDLTGTKVETTRQEREARGLNAVEKQAYQAIGQSYEAGKSSVEDGSLDPRSLSRAVADKPRPLSSTEVGALGYDRARLINEHRQALKTISDAVDTNNESAVNEGRTRLQRIEEDLDFNDRALEKGGREQSAAFNARKMLIRDDYSLASIVQRAKAKTGKDLTPEFRAKLEDLTKQLEQKDTLLAQKDEAYKKLEAQRAVKRIIDDVAREQRRQKRVVTKQDLDAQFAQLSTAFSAKLENRLNANPLDPELIKIVGQMAKNRVLAGVNTVDGLVDHIHSALKDYVEDKRQIRDAISGYGVTQKMADDLLSVRLRELKRQMRLVSAIEDAEGGERPAKSGLQREPDSQKVRDLRRQLEDELRKSGIRVREPQPPKQGPSVSQGTGPKEGPKLGRRQGPDLSDARREGPKLSEGQGRVEGPRLAEASKQGPSLTDARLEGPRLSESVGRKEGPRDWLPDAKKRLQSQIDELESKVQRGDFTRPPKREPLPLDREGAQLKAERDKLKLTIDREIERQARLNRPPIQKVMDNLTAIRRAGLLTSIKTHLRNFTSNAIFQATEEVTRPMAALADMAASRFTGQRSTRGFDPKGVAEGIKEFSTAGVKDAIDIIRGKEVLPLEGKKSDASKLQLDASDTGIKLLDNYVNGVFRSLEASDRMFKLYAFKRELIDISKSQALTEARKDSSINLRERTKELQNSPTDAMIAEAASYADYATFQNDNRVSSAIRSGKQKLGPAGKFAIEQIAPFDRTPTNIIYRAFENSPLGLISAGRKLSKLVAAQKVGDEVFTRSEQKEFARTFGRASTGTILAALGMSLAAKGLLTGSSDFDSDKNDYMKKRREAGGPCMLKVGSQWIYIGDNPVGKGICTAASVYEQMTKPNATTEQKVTGALGAVSRLALEQPLAQATKNLFESKSASEAGGNYVGSFVPAIVKDVGEVTDPQARKLYADKNASSWEKFITPLMGRVPGLRQRLPVDTSKEPTERGGVLRRAVRAIDPFNTTTEGMGPKKLQRGSRPSLQRPTLRRTP
jgi:hypothetical protein